MTAGRPLPERVVIVGAGQAGGTCAAALRQSGFAGSVTLIGEEPYPPYERPPLSKELLTGVFDIERTFLRPRAWYSENGIALETELRVQRIDRNGGAAVLSDGRHMPYDALVLATGATERRLPLPGSDCPGVHYLRRIPDSLALRDCAKPGSRLVVIGAGLIGLEVAANSRTLGAEVVVVEAAERAMVRVGPPELSATIEALHRSHGVEVLTSVAVTRIDMYGERLAVQLRDGCSLGADAVVIGIGIEPASALALTADLPVNDGVVVDEFGRTADPHIWAIGDCAALLHPLLGRRVRLEAWQHAQNHAIAVARNILGAEDPYRDVPWAWTDQYGVNVQFAGLPLEYDRAVWRGDPQTRNAVLLQLKQEVLVGAIALNSPREMRTLRRMIGARAKLDAVRAADRSARLEEAVA